MLFIAFQFRGNVRNGGHTYTFLPGVRDITFTRVP